MQINAKKNLMRLAARGLEAPGAGRVGHCYCSFFAHWPQFNGGSKTHDAPVDLLVVITNGLHPVQTVETGVECV